MSRTTVLVLLLFVLIPAPAARAEVAVTDSVTVLDDVVVTDSRYEGATRLNVTNVTREEIERREPDLELPLLLNTLPGVYSYGDAGSGLGYTYLRIRGFDQRRVGVLLNGIPLNDPEDHQVWWVDLVDLPESVEDIQVQRGVTNSVGGMTAIGGTVNIVARDMAAAPEGKVSVNAGSYGFARQMLSYQTGKLGGGLSSSFRLSRQESDGFRDRSGYEGWGVFWSGMHETDRTTTRVNVHTGKELTRHAWDAVPESVLRENRRANAETYHNAVDDFRQPHYELHHDRYLSDAVTLTNRLYYIQGEGFYENFKEGDRAGDYALDRLGFAADDDVDLIRRKYVRKDHVGWVPSVHWRQGSGGRLLLGGDVYTFHSNHWGEVLWAEGFAPGDFTDEFKYHEYTGDKDQWSVYANQRVNLTDDLILTADLHFQHKEYAFAQKEVGNFTGTDRHAYRVEYDFFNPKAALNFAVPGRVLGGDLALYGTVGINHREPTDGELFDTWQSGSDLGVEPLFHERREVRRPDGSVDHVEWSNPKVREERVVDYEFGAGWKSAAVSVTVGGYWMDFRDEIVPYGGVGEDGSGIRGNAGRTRHRGIELGARARLARGHGLVLAASKSWDEFEEFIFTDWDGSVSDLSGNPIALFPEQLLLADWNADWSEGVRTRLRARHTGRQHLDNTGESERTIDPWTTVDVSLWLDLGALGWRALEGTTAFAHLRNLADTEYEVWGYWFGENYLTPAAGRNFVVGVDYTY